MLVQVGNHLYTLSKGQVLQIPAGQTLRVHYSFIYKVVEPTSIPVWGSLYRYTAGFLDRSAKAQTKMSVTLEPATEWQIYQGYIDIAIDPGIDKGLWGLIIEAPGFANAEDKIDDCIEVTEAAGIQEWLGPLLVIGLLGMLMQTLGPAMAEVTE